MCRIIFLSVFLFFMVNAKAQQNNHQSDTLNHKEYLPDVTVVGTDIRTTTYQLPEIVGTHIFAGKKNALVVVNNVNGNVVTNTMRQILAKVPGIHIWESDGSGVQIGIATRGLSANRSWDFNVRQNGFDISADPFGYPEAYYNPPMQAVQRLQIVKGAGSLQYGPQMGGMINYVLKNGHNLTKPFILESQQTVGSFGLLNTYNAIGGKYKKSNYYAFFDHRQANGFRKNSTYKTNTAFATFNHQFNTQLKVGVEVLNYYLLGQQPGGLTDAQLATDVRQSSRARNWMNIDWITASTNIDYHINEHQHFNLKISYLSGNRNSIGFINSINIQDTINASTGNFNNRAIDIDQYRNTGAELRYLNNYRLGKISNTLTASVKYFRGLTNRLRNGKGNINADFSKDNLNPTFSGDLHFETIILAASVENVLRLNKLLIIPGVRVENLQANVSGRLSYNANGTENLVNNLSKQRTFALFALATEYHLKVGEIYGNITQSYRPIQFADLAVSATTDIVDANLKDGKAYNIDVGYRGKIKNFLSFDANIFYLHYANRIGTIVQQRTDLTIYNFRTNVGTSISKGVEAVIEFNPMQANLWGKKLGEISVFANYSYTNATYTNFKIVTKSSTNTLIETNLKNNQVENAPEHILRSGLTYMLNSFSLTTQVSYVSSTFADATNTLLPNAAATVGLIPAYTIVDIAATYRYKIFNCKAGLNNITNAIYFTRRAGGFPGPGLMPSDGRNFFVSVGVNM